MTITRKKNTGEPGNGGHFGSTARAESAVALEAAEPDAKTDVEELFALQLRDSNEPSGWRTVATHETSRKAFGDLRFSGESRVRPMTRTTTVLDRVHDEQRVSDPDPYIMKYMSSGSVWQAFSQFAQNGYGMDAAEVRQQFDIGSVISQSTAKDKHATAVTSSTQQIMAALEENRWDWAETDEDLCHDRGPRIGGADGSPHCRLTKGHASKRHTTDPEADGWDHTWTDLT